MNGLRGLLFASAAVFVVVLVGAWLSAESNASAQSQAPAQPNAPPSLTGAWTLNKDLSDKPPDRSQEGQNGDRSGGGSGYGHGGGYGRGGGGGYGRGGYGGRGGMGGGSGSSLTPEERERIREAMRNIVTAPDHLTITESSNMVVVTTSEGQVTRLSTDGKKIKDENTKIERKTKWDAGKLVSEINGMGPGKITETYSIDPQAHQLHVTVTMEGGRMPKPVAMNRVYDADSATRD